MENYHGTTIVSESQKVLAGAARALPHRRRPA